MEKLLLIKKINFKIQMFILLIVILLVGFIGNINIYANSPTLPPGVILRDYRGNYAPHPTKANDNIKKPTAKFRIETPRGILREGDTGTVLVGETIRIVDESTVGDGSMLNLWDFQYWSKSTSFAQYLTRKPDREIVIDSDGVWRFFLNVRDNMSVRHSNGGMYYNFSENGNHQALDTRKEQSHGEWWYWYFSNITIVAEYGYVEIRYIDIDTGEEISQPEIHRTLPAGEHIFPIRDIQDYDFIKSEVKYK